MRTTRGYQTMRLPQITRGPLLPMPVRRSAGLRIHAKRYRRLLGVSPGDDLPTDRALSAITPSVKWWVLAAGLVGVFAHIDLLVADTEPRLAGLGHMVLAEQPSVGVVVRRFTPAGCPWRVLGALSEQ